MTIGHNQFRKFNATNDILIKSNMDNVKKTFLFLKENVYPYIYCYIFGTQSKISKINFATNDGDFMHMCGIKYDYEKSKDKFIYDLTKEDINYKKLMVHSDGTTNQKFQVISAVPYLFNSLNVCVSNEKQTRISFNYDGYIATNKKILSIGLKNVNNNFFVPRTLLNLHTERKQPVGEPVHTILRKHRNTKTIDIVETDNSIEFLDPSDFFK
ncbi:MAG: hypothetical protein ABF695_12260 [Liquorilactobacillus ghanensis]|uniref:PBECR4 domain-containing protein n=1 Tax=Liquorilactobacillus ghanensis TaxID=399370 RepID=UPI0039E790EF